MATPIGTIFGWIGTAYYLYELTVGTVLKIFNSIWESLVYVWALRYIIIGIFVTALFMTYVWAQYHPVILETIDEQYTCAIVPVLYNDSLQTFLQFLVSQFSRIWCYINGFVYVLRIVIIDFFVTILADCPDLLVDSAVQFIDIIIALVQTLVVDLLLNPIYGDLDLVTVVKELSEFLIVLAEILGCVCEFLEPVWRILAISVNDISFQLFVDASVDVILWFFQEPIKVLFHFLNPRAPCPNNEACGNLDCPEGMEDQCGGDVGWCAGSWASDDKFCNNRCEFNPLCAVVINANATDVDGSSPLRTVECPPGELPYGNANCPYEVFPGDTETLFDILENGEIVYYVRSLSQCDFICIENPSVLLPNIQRLVDDICQALVAFGEWLDYLVRCLIDTFIGYAVFFDIEVSVGDIQDAPPAVEFIPDIFCVVTRFFCWIVRALGTLVELLLQTIIFAINGIDTDKYLESYLNYVRILEPRVALVFQDIELWIDCTARLFIGFYLECAYTAIGSSLRIFFVRIPELVLDFLFHLDQLIDESLVGIQLDVVCDGECGDDCAVFNDDLNPDEPGYIERCETCNVIGCKQDTCPTDCTGVTSEVTCIDACIEVMGCQSGHFFEESKEACIKRCEPYCDGVVDEIGCEVNMCLPICHDSCLGTCVDECKDELRNTLSPLWINERFTERSDAVFNEAILAINGIEECLDGLIIDEFASGVVDGWTCFFGIFTSSARAVVEMFRVAWDVIRYLLAFILGDLDVLNPASERSVAFNIDLDPIWDELRNPNPISNPERRSLAQCLENVLCLLPPLDFSNLDDVAFLSALFETTDAKMFCGIGCVVRSLVESFVEVLRWLTEMFRGLFAVWVQSSSLDNVSARDVVLSLFYKVYPYDDIWNTLREPRVPYCPGNTQCGWCEGTWTLDVTIYSQGQYDIQSGTFGDYDDTCGDVCIPNPNYNPYDDDDSNDNYHTNCPFPAEIPISRFIGDISPGRETEVIMACDYTCQETSQLDCRRKCKDSGVCSANASPLDPQPVYIEECIDCKTDCDASCTAQCASINSKQECIDDYCRTTLSSQSCDAIVTTPNVKVSGTWDDSLNLCEVECDNVCNQDAICEATCKEECSQFHDICLVECDSVCDGINSPQKCYKDLCVPICNKPCEGQCDTICEEMDGNVGRGLPSYGLAECVYEMLRIFGDKIACTVQYVIRALVEFVRVVYDFVIHVDEIIVPNFGKSTSDERDIFILRWDIDALWNELRHPDLVPFTNFFDNDQIFNNDDDDDGNLFLWEDDDDFFAIIEYDGTTAGFIDDDDFNDVEEWDGKTRGEIVQRRALYDCVGLFVAQFWELPGCIVRHGILFPGVPGLPPVGRFGVEVFKGTVDFLVRTFSFVQLQSGLFRPVQQESPEFPGVINTDNVYDSQIVTYDEWYEDWFGGTLVEKGITRQNFRFFDAFFDEIIVTINCFVDILRFFSECLTDLIMAPIRIVVNLIRMVFLLLQTTAADNNRELTEDPDQIWQSFLLGVVDEVAIILASLPCIPEELGAQCFDTIGLYWRTLTVILEQSFRYWIEAIFIIIENDRVEPSMCASACFDACTAKNAISNPACVSDCKGVCQLSKPTDTDTLLENMIISIFRVFISFIDFLEETISCYLGIGSLGILRDLAELAERIILVALRPFFDLLAFAIDALMDIISGDFIGFLQTTLLYSVEFAGSLAGVVTGITAIYLDLIFDILLVVIPGLDGLVPLVDGIVECFEDFGGCIADYTGGAIGGIFGRGEVDNLSPMELTQYIADHWEYSMDNSSLCDVVVKAHAGVNINMLSMDMKIRYYECIQGWKHALEVRELQRQQFQGKRQYPSVFEESQFPVDFYNNPTRYLSTTKTILREVHSYFTLKTSTMLDKYNVTLDNTALKGVSSQNVIYGLGPSEYNTCHLTDDASYNEKALFTNNTIAQQCTYGDILEASNLPIVGYAPWHSNEVIDKMDDFLDKIPDTLLELTKAVSTIDFNWTYWIEDFQTTHHYSNYVTVTEEGPGFETGDVSHKERSFGFVQRVFENESNLYVTPSENLSTEAKTVSEVTYHFIEGFFNVSQEISTGWQKRNLTDRIDEAYAKVTEALILTSEGRRSNTNTKMKFKDVTYATPVMPRPPYVHGYGVYDDRTAESFLQNRIKEILGSNTSMRPDSRLVKSRQRKQFIADRTSYRMRQRIYLRTYERDNVEQSGKVVNNFMRWHPVRIATDAMALGREVTKLTWDAIHKRHVTPAIEIVEVTQRSWFETRTEDAARNQAMVRAWWRRFKVDASVLLSGDSFLRNRYLIERDVVRAEIGERTLGERDAGVVELCGGKNNTDPEVMCEECQLFTTIVNEAMGQLERCARYDTMTRGEVCDLVRAGNITIAGSLTDRSIISTLLGINVTALGERHALALDARETEEQMDIDNRFSLTKSVRNFVKSAFPAFHAFLDSDLGSWFTNPNTNVQDYPDDVGLLFYVELLGVCDPYISLSCCYGLGFRDGLIYTVIIVTVIYFLTWNYLPGIITWFFGLIFALFSISLGILLFLFLAYLYSPACLFPVPIPFALPLISLPECLFEDTAEFFGTYILPQCLWYINPVFVEADGETVLAADPATCSLVDCENYDRTSLNCVDDQLFRDGVDNFVFTLEYFTPGVADLFRDNFLLNWILLFDYFDDAFDRFNYEDNADPRIPPEDTICSIITSPNLLLFGLVLFLLYRVFMIIIGIAVQWFTQMYFFTQSIQPFIDSFTNSGFQERTSSNDEEEFLRGSSPSYSPLSEDEFLPLDWILFAQLGGSEADQMVPPELTYLNSEFPDNVTSVPHIHIHDHGLIPVQQDGNGRYHVQAIHLPAVHAAMSTYGIPYRVNATGIQQRENGQLQRQQPEDMDFTQRIQDEWNQVRGQLHLWRLRFFGNQQPPHHLHADGDLM